MKPTLKQTSNYELFIDNEEQPMMKKSNLKKLRQSMSAIGFRPSKPIQVEKSGSKLKIIDGHHRFYTAKELGLPVYYVVEDNVSQDVMTFVNTSMRVWGLKDYIQMYCKRGLHDYCVLSEYMDKGLNCGIATELLGVPSKIRSGEFKVVTTKFADFILTILDDVKDKHPHLKKNTFSRALAKIMMVKGLDRERLREQCDKHANLIQDLSNVSDMIDEIETVYNFRKKGSARMSIAFEAKKITRKPNEETE